MPIALFNAISVRHPATTIQFLRLIASRMKQASSLLHRSLTPGAAGPVAQKGGNTNLKTVCILPATRNVPIAAFATKLRNALEDIGAPTSYLDQASVMRQLGRHAFSKMGKLKVANWLADQEQRFRIVLYVIDTPVTSQWTMTSIRQVGCSLRTSGRMTDPSLRRPISSWWFQWATIQPWANTKNSSSQARRRLGASLSYCIRKER